MMIPAQPLHTHIQPVHPNLYFIYYTIYAIKFEYVLNKISIKIVCNDYPKFVARCVCCCSYVTVAGS